MECYGEIVGAAHETDDEYDSEYDAMSASTYGTNSEAQTITSADNKKSLREAMMHEDDSINLKDEDINHHEPQGQYSEKASNNGTDTFSLNDIPEEDLDDIELDDMAVNRYERPFPNGSISKAGPLKKKGVKRSEIHFKSSGKNRRFVPTL